MFKERVELYKKIEEERKSKLIVYVTGDRPGLETQISPEAQDYFVNHLDKFKGVEKISLYLYTRGGDTMAAWSLINLLKQFCKEYEVIIPSKARSAGTLISLGASSIMMTKQATLGPIDPSLNTPLNPHNPQFPQNPLARVPVSVESIKGFFDFAKEELSIKSENHLATIFNTLSSQIHPIVLGNVFRSRTQIQMLANRLLSEHFKDADGKADKIKNIISFLCSDSGSHDYPIYRKEAKDLLKLNIEKPTEEFYKTIKFVYDDIQKELQLTQPYSPNIVLGIQETSNYTHRRSLIESIDGGTEVFVSEGILTKKVVQIQPQPGLPPIQQNTINDQRNFEGWKHE